MDAQAAEQTLRELTEQAPTVAEADRHRLLSAVKKLASSLEKPEDAAFAQILIGPMILFGIRMGVDLGIFRKLVERGGIPISATELAAKCGAEELLLVRIMRIITSTDYAAESGEREYVATPLSHAMLVPHVEAFAIHSLDHGGRVAGRTPDYFKEHGYSSPTDALRCPFQFTMGIADVHLFDWLHADTERAEAFNVAMMGSKGGRQSWFEWYPVAERLLAPFEASKTDDSVFLIDMGGGKGHHLEALIKKFPATANHVVLQDLPATISALPDTLHAGIRPMVHDIFTAQCVPGALAYYTHFVLHDFTDDKCRAMLRAVAAVMTPGYSRLLINEAVIPERGCPSWFAAADITMMVLLAGIQRSRRHWVELVESAGLRVVQVWVSPDPGDVEGVIEAEVVA